MLVTFVCTGNTCRSAMAEGILKKIISDKKIENINCKSCGLAAFTGDSASPLAIKAVGKMGVDISLHRSTQINEYIVKESDIIVCMTNRHKKAVMSVKPQCRVIVPYPEISDPYGGNEQIYDMCAEQIKSFILKFIDSITMEIVTLDSSHIERIAELEKLCFSAPWTSNMISAELENNTAHFLCADLGEKLLGYIGVHEVAGEAYITNVAVNPQYRHLGIGEKLVLTASNAAKQRNCDFISLEVRKSNSAAVALYSKLGYNTAGERKNFYTKPSEDAYIMTLNFGSEDR